MYGLAKALGGGGGGELFPAQFQLAVTLFILPAHFFHEFVQSLGSILKLSSCFFVHPVLFFFCLTLSLEGKGGMEVLEQKIKQSCWVVSAKCW